MKIFNSIGHFFAWILGKAVPVAAAVVAADQSPLAQAIVGLLGSRGQAVQDGIQAIAGDVLKAFGDAGAAVGAGGLNVQFDQATIAAIEALYRDLGGLFGKSKNTAPATSAAKAAAGK
ncbi:MAG TPA: hypothetical protein VNE83_04675 [Terriglobales bacterium]|nr:hypothetical protein [Terriglobales bacterium]